MSRTTYIFHAANSEGTYYSSLGGSLIFVTGDGACFRCSLRGERLLSIRLPSCLRARDI
jgi:hypothetical protein